MRLSLFGIVSVALIAGCLTAASPQDDLLAAARYGNVAAARRALGAGACIGLRDIRGYTPLMWASAGGHADVARLLLDRGLNVDAALPAHWEDRFESTTKPRTAVELAAANGHAEVLRVLLGHNPRQFRDALRFAIDGGHPDAAALLARIYALASALVTAIDEGDERRTRELLAQGAPANSSLFGVYGYARETSRVPAVTQREMAALLLGAGADPWLGYRVSFRIGEPLRKLLADARMRSPEALLRAAVRDRDSARISELLCRGADPDAAHEGETTAIANAFRNGDTAAVRLLLAYGAASEGTSLAVAKQVAQEARRPELAALLDEARAAPVIAVLTGVRQALAEAGARGPQSAASSRELTRANEAIARLEDLWRKWKLLRRELPSAYPAFLETLRADSAELQTSLRSGNGAAIVRAIREVADDLETKADHCAALGGLDMDVKLSVHTRRGNEEVRNWQVLYLSSIFEFAGDVRPEFFPRFSSPSVENVPPGRYFIWARDPKTGREGERFKIKISGKQEMSVDVAVP